MNIFFLSTNTKLCAEYHNDKHVVKMILETAQLLSTAHAILDNDGKQVEGMYKPTHINHPCAIWVRKTRDNYIWTSNLLYWLLEEYTHRYNKVHKVKEMYDELVFNPKNIIDSFFTTPALAMPDEYKNSDPVEAYRNYYIGEKRHIAKWTNRQIPSWWK